jgi:hypothetical protein
MANFVLIYDPNDSDFAKMGPEEAKKLGATPYGVRDVPDLKALFLKLKQIDKMIVYTHGDPGSIIFGTSVLTARRLTSDFSGGGFESLFSPGALVLLYGCNVAAIKANCGLPAACSETENGVVFLRSFAQTFLKKGGRITGNTAKGIAIPMLSTTPRHPGGTDVHAIVNPNQKAYGGVRMAIGDELSRPYDNNSDWKVWDGKEYFYYSFSPIGTGPTSATGQVSWRNGFEDDNDDKDQLGTWSQDKDYLRIQWQSEKENWDLPLFSDYQTGISVGDSDFAFPGRPGQGGTGDVWAETIERPKSMAEYFIDRLSD